MPRYQKKPVVVEAYQVTAGNVGTGVFGTVTGAVVGDWIIVAVDGTMTKLTNAQFVTLYTETTADSILTGTDID